MLSDSTYNPRVLCSGFPNSWGEVSYSYVSGQGKELYETFLHTFSLPRPGSPSYGEKVTKFTKA